MMTMRWRGADAGGAPEALRRVAACTPRQCALSALLVCAGTLAAIQLRAYTWLALFAALLLPLGASAGVMLLMQRHVRGRGWAALWAALLALGCASTAAAGWIYALGLSWIGIDPLNEAQVMAVQALLFMLLFVLPLWMARHRARTLHIAQLSQAAMASDLKALQAQIEPHFLYNTLANTRYLVRHQPERALGMLDHLIAYLRSALPDLRSPMSTLGRECELAAHYLELMAIRYGDRLSVHIACADEVRDLALPPLMLMPLVENAVQHGVEPHAGAVAVTVQARRADGRVLVAVRDNGAGLGNAVLGSGVGLRNVRQRLEALYGGAASLRLSVGADGWTVAELNLPLSRPESA
ncbi:signal transduction histidine kinase [Duganella sp. SG902]|uniref:sensor histidine kinase n=1 Tax=Duganella sp. SG902 TaxID=2587016 RepID=UPI00159D871A|nr:histidine kinase [Duganella sp. SG902]NVM79382.1 signal transduction histidine kinase [Duganella sp. SG902]